MFLVDTNLLVYARNRHAAEHVAALAFLEQSALMFEHGVREIRTADEGFHRFRFLNVVNPLREA